MTTYLVYAKHHLMLRTRSKTRADSLAAAVSGGYVVKVERPATFGELWAVPA